jgi:acetyltransferase-like isoleucine patch superfamily enzyme
MNFIQKLMLFLFTLVARAFIKNISRSARISKLTGIFGGKNVTIKSNVLLWDTWLAAVSPDDSKVELIIDEGATIGRFNHIYATKRIEIGKNVLTADRVYIADNVHQYEDINVPIKNQPVKQLGEVYIGDGSWIGENACIIGARIGKNCVIGANAVVLKNIPDYSVAVGIPAKVIKRFNQEINEWVKI